MMAEESKVLFGYKVSTIKHKGWYEETFENDRVVGHFTSPIEDNSFTVFVWDKKNAEAIAQFNGYDYSDDGSDSYKVFVDLMMSVKIYDISGKSGLYPESGSVSLADQLEKDMFGGE